MILLDTDTVSLLASGQPEVAQRAKAATDTVATTVVTRIEILLIAVLPNRSNQFMETSTVRGGRCAGRLRDCKTRSASDQSF